MPRRRDPRLDPARLEVHIERPGPDRGRAVMARRAALVRLARAAIDERRAARCEAAT